MSTVPEHVGSSTWRRLLAGGSTALMVFLIGCNGSRLESGETARSVALGTPEVTDDGQRWVMTVALDDQYVSGDTTVQIAFDAADVRCEDGEDVIRTAIQSDAFVSFRSADRGAGQPRRQPWLSG
ncbi:MAG: hypothetical protein HY828_04220 [Actinobacteria bacterium]|nr:hypothetical protein [Actinomycetota bacterium]